MPEASSTPVADPDPRLVDGRPTCPACGGEGRSRRYQVEDYDLHRCADCRTEFLVLRPGGSPAKPFLWDAYKFKAHTSEQSQAQYAARYVEVFDEARKYTSTVHDVLDIGCGIGNFLDWAGGQGLSAVGAELDQDAIDAARGRGLTVHSIDDMASKVEPGSVDIVTMWDVIEHLVDPAAGVKDSVPFLRPGGLMIFETPDVSFPLRPISIGVRKVCEPIRYSDVLYFSGHRTYFSADGLGRLLEDQGLEVMTHFGLRSPAAKMQTLIGAMDENGKGLLGATRLYGPLERAMKTLHVTNKMIMIARRPWV